MSTAIEGSAPTFLPRPVHNTSSIDGKPLRIAQIAPLAECCPPRLYGGTERIVSFLTEELVRLGHDVTLFASGDSRTRAKLVPCTDMALRLNPAVRDPIPYHMIMLDQVRRRAEEFDILHFHVDVLHAPLVSAFASRTVTTLHGRLDLPDLVPFYRAFPELPLISISDAQRRPMPPVNWVGTVPHGVPVDRLPFVSEPAGDYLAFLGRISPEKRPDRAIAIAAGSGMPLKIAAKVDKVDQAYWDEVIAPLIAVHPNVSFIGEINDEQKPAFLGNARALLFPIDWPEPFGLVMIEAMACGTPVIAFGSGSVPEVIDDGVSGFIVHDVDQAVEAVSHLNHLSRSRVRETFLRRFTVEHMARAYVTIYRGLLENSPGEAQPSPPLRDVPLQVVA
ncbi:MAG: glycosyltransferase family 4 protein [Chelatococcus sp.]|nr:glycosyltransferase family 4 protein [Chelatococcus sp. HY11]MBX3536977.1 glycosyltransferase family 4 protein [Chelatococcus sp.]MBX3543670.1 glycosyltransferase family 4 protein [Chelatococcus sp.]CAH1670617.1 Glycosyltransferase involved in cell wall biosynthesis [Hyphomicrobiales bacterium]CAH1677188.1 Glycosyltransferase involved in cell wall biosynthesis [Hyphomicrobiales bacterium]